MSRTPNLAVASGFKPDWAPLPRITHCLARESGYDPEIALSERAVFPATPFPNIGNGYWNRTNLHGVKARRSPRLLSRIKLYYSSEFTARSVIPIFFMSCLVVAFPTVGWSGRPRSDTLRFKRPLLCQLSYEPVFVPPIRWRRPDCRDIQKFTQGHFQLRVGRFTEHRTQNSLLKRQDFCRIKL